MPFVVIVGGILHEGQRVSMCLAGVAIIGAAIKNLWVRSFIWYWILWIMLMMVMSHYGKLPPMFTQKAFVMTAYMALAFMFFLAMQESKIKIESIYNIICIAAIIQALLATLQMNGIDLQFELLKLYAKNVEKGLAFKTPTGSLGNNNFLAVYLAISFPFFFRKYWAYFTPVLLAVILCSLTSTAVVALMIGCIVYFRDKVRWRWLVLASIPFMIYLFMTKASLTWKFTWDHDRFDWWRASLILWKEGGLGSMLFGFGPTMTWGKNFPIHNEWITALFNFGIIGAGLAVGYFVTLYRKNRILYSAIIIACVTFNGTYPLHLAPSIMLIMIILGTMEREKHGRRHANHDRAVHRIYPVPIEIENPVETQAETKQL